MFILKCAWCGQIMMQRNLYLEEHVSHGICTSCAERYFHLVLPAAEEKPR